jgi:hypothetical protein
MEIGESWGARSNASSKIQNEVAKILTQQILAAAKLLKKAILV